GSIGLECLEKEAHRRYASALALAEDLERFLTGDPIQARPTTLGERAIKWAKRRPAVAALVAVSVAAGLCLAAAGRGYLDQRARLAENQLTEIRRGATLQSGAQDLISQGEAAIARKDWPGAKAALEKALAKIGSETSLADLAARARRGVAETDRRLEEQQARQSTDRDFEHFFR